LDYFENKLKIIEIKKCFRN